MSEETLIQLSTPVFDLMNQYEKENVAYSNVMMSQVSTDEDRRMAYELILQNKKYKLIEEAMWMGFIIAGVIIFKKFDLLPVVSYAK